MRLEEFLKQPAGAFSSSFVSRGEAGVCVCVRVCEREKERERERHASTVFANSCAAYTRVCMSACLHVCMSVQVGEEKEHKRWGR